MQEGCGKRYAMFGYAEPNMDERILGKIIVSGLSDGIDLTILHCVSLLP